jgi:hypothetical protein
MRNVGCAREHDLLTALQSSRWPDACDDALRSHVASCRSCAELVDLSLALLDDHRALVQEAAVPSSAIVWWRAQMRSRREAAEQVTQPITVVQGLALACAAGLLVAAAGYFNPTFRRAIEWSVSAVKSFDGLPLPLPTAETLANPMIAGGIAAVCLAVIVAPIALYFALHEE